MFFYEFNVQENLKENKIKNKDDLGRRYFLFYLFEENLHGYYSLDGGLDRG